METTLDKITTGGSARVVSIEGAPFFRQRLLELGLTPDARVRVVRVAPLRDPIELSVRGTRLSLRRSDASRINVVALTAQEAAERAPACEGRRAASGERETPAGGRPRLRSSMSPREVSRVALVGNPNTGKTSLFNALTGANASVGNYPGITVDRRKGRTVLGGEHTPGEAIGVEIVDVPGTYSLNARARDEQVAIDEILGRTGDGPLDLAVVVLSATALQRSVYLLLQIQELGVPVVAAVNMMDEAREQGFDLDFEGFSRHFGVPVVGVAARSGEGIEGLREAMAARLSEASAARARPWHWEPSQDLSQHLDDIAQAVGPLAGEGASQDRRRAIALWCLMSLSDDDDLRAIPAEVRDKTRAIKAEMLSHGHDLDLEVVIARYRHIDDDVDAFLRYAPSPRSRRITEKLDRVFTHPVAGLAVFVLTIGLIFTALFDWSAPAIDVIGAAVGAAGRGLRAVLPEGVMTDLLVDGVFAGVGAVLVFLPQILLLFFFITLLEGSGYMARVAFIIDRLMHKIGLNGKAFVPMMSGFACAVPAVLATRTIEDRRDRLVTIMVIPLITCSARLPVYTLIIGAMFAADERLFGPLSIGAALMLAAYLASILLSLAAAAVLSRTVLKGEPQPLVLELPPYRMPLMRFVLRLLVMRAQVFLKTAGTIIVVASTILWGLLSFPAHTATPPPPELVRAAAGGDHAAQVAIDARQRAEALEHSYAGRMGRFIEPALEPLGFDWKIGVGLIGAFAAREVFVSTMGLVYGLGDAAEEDAGLRDALKRQKRPDGQPAYTPLVGLSLIVFFMLAMQCLSTVAVVRQETGSWGWAGFQIVYMTGLAYVASLLTFQIGSFLGLG